MEIENWSRSEEGEEGQSLSMVSSKDSMDFLSLQKSLIFPKENTQLDNKLITFHLLKAYGEAMKKRQEELLEIILMQLEEKSCPRGEIVQPLTYYLTKTCMQPSTSYLRQESFKNYKAAFLAFYQIFPYGRFVHLVANSTILEALPEGTDTLIRIVDFDIGEGVQWPPLIESLARRKHREVRISSVKWEKDEYSPTLFQCKTLKRQKDIFVNSRVFSM